MDERRMTGLAFAYMCAHFRCPAVSDAADGIELLIRKMAVRDHRKELLKNILYCCFTHYYCLRASWCHLLIFCPGGF